jgi:hypothetical protein
LELPASEIEFWRAYYSIFPFPQERADARAALIAQTIANMSGRMLKDIHLRSLEDFLPDYIDTVSTQKSLKAQADADRAFGTKLAAMQSNT